MTVRSFISISRADCSEAVWELLESRGTEIERLRKELVQAYIRLCKYEGHLPITDSNGITWCELCEQKIDQSEKKDTN